MVDDRVEGEVDPLYLHWFFDQSPLKIMPEGSTREIIDREEEIEVRIKEAQLEVERKYMSTLDILSNELKNVKEELSRHDAIFEERVTLIEKRLKRSIYLLFEPYMKIWALSQVLWSNRRKNITKKKSS